MCQTRWILLSSTKLYEHNLGYYKKKSDIFHSWCWCPEMRIFSNRFSQMSDVRSNIIDIKGILFFTFFYLFILVIIFIKIAMLEWITDYQLSDVFAYDGCSISTHNDFVSHVCSFNLRFSLFTDCFGF